MEGFPIGRYLKTAAQGPAIVNYLKDVCLFVPYILCYLTGKGVASYSIIDASLLFLKFAVFASISSLLQGSLFMKS